MNTPPVRTRPAQVIPLTPAFKWVFISIVGLTLLSLLISVLTALADNPNDLQRTLFSTCMDIWKMGFTGILGLLGGKAL